MLDGAVAGTASALAGARQRRHGKRTHEHAHGRSPHCPSHILEQHQRPASGSTKGKGNRGAREPLPTSFQQSQILAVAERRTANRLARLPGGGSAP